MTLNAQTVSETDVRATLNRAAQAAEQKGGFGLVALDVAAQFALADVFLVVSGSVERNVQAISDSIEDALNASGVRTIRREGREGGRWILLDFGDLIVHVFHQEERDFYQLEKLWQDCPIVELPESSTTASDLRSTPDDGVK